MDGLSIGVLSEKQEKQLENHEVYNLISDESEPERELIPIHSYISSSSPESGIGISNPSNIEIIKENTSLEIEAPFYEDDLNKSGISITFDDTEFSSQEKVSEQKKNVRILDGILSQDSYSFYKDDSEGSTEISGHDLKYLAKKWRSASQDITTSKTLKSNLKNTKQKKYLISQELQGCNIFNCSSQEKLSSQQSLNILSEFPLSSPVQRNDSEDDSKRMLFKKSFPADKIIQTENTLKKGKCVELKDPNKHSIPDETGALGLSRRLETGDETSISDTPSKLKKILTVNSHSEFLNSLPNLVSLVGKQHNDPSIRFIKYAHLNVRSGKDKKDVLSKVLNHIGRMPELKVEKVVKAYPSFQSLHGDFNKRQLKSGLDGQHIMSEAMEKRLYKLFTCTDPDQPIE